VSNFFSIVTVTYNDEWALTKTLRSIFSQKFKNYELVVVDGLSKDNTKELVSFWQKHDLVSTYICEKDNGVYDAMNKGAKAATGDYIVYMNAGDVFSTNDVLENVYEKIQSEPCDALMGWGELNGQLWTSWVISQAFRMASLGFCHQSLYVKRKLCLEYPLDSRPFKTDSDIMQLSNIIAENKLILLDDVLAIRSGDEGISANLNKTKNSVSDSILNNYPELTEEVAEKIISFRRKCSDPDAVFTLLKSLKGDTLQHLTLLVLDTLYQPQSKVLTSNCINSMMESCIAVLRLNCGMEEAILDDFLRVQYKRADHGTLTQENKKIRNTEISLLREECDKKFGPYVDRASDDYIVTLTTFPKRIASVSLVIESLLRQTIPPSRIFLNLGRNEFPHEGWLPSQLLELQKKGLVLNFVDITTHQYDKFLHVFKENTKLPLVMVDDDVIYPPNSMEYLIKGHRKHPKYIISNRPHMMKWENDTKLALYADWEKEVNDSFPLHDLFPTGAGGVLYPVGFFDQELACNKSMIMEVAPYADDIWLKACSIVKGIPVVCSEMLKNERWYYRYTPQMSEGALHKTNVDLGLNDMQLISSFDHFKIKRDPNNKFWIQEIK
jgi:glycosyltransferase involved in cell wall biosynthesis